MNLFRTKESFEPTYLDSEEYYRQNQNQASINQVNRFSPSEQASSYVAGYNNGYNNNNLFDYSSDYYKISPGVLEGSQQDWSRDNSMYGKKTINGVLLKDYYDKYTSDVLNGGTWLLNKDMPQDTKQYLEDSQVQQRMEIFTGLRQERDRQTLGMPTKREVKNLFTPSEQTTGYGYQYGSSGAGPGLAITRQKEFEDMKKTIKMKTNEQPFEKIQVGPGIAIGTEVPAAGGFHQFARIMPDNISDHTANQLPGMVTGGKWLFSNAPTSQAPVVKNRPDAFYTLCQHEVMPGRSTVTAESTRPDYAVTLRNQNRSFINYGYGVPLNPSLDKFLTI
jgi:hypothetical protein